MQKPLAKTLAVILFSCSLLGGAPGAFAAQSAPPTPQPPATAPDTASSLPPASVAIIGGTPVTVQLVDKISSGTAAVGNTFAVKVAEDIVVDGFVAIPKGASGQGEVLSVERAGSHGHAGSLGIQMDWVYALDGEKVRLSSQRKSEEGESKAGVSSTMTIVSWAFLGLPGLFVHNWVKGREIELDGTHPLQAYVDDTVHVVSTVKASSETRFAH